MPGFVLGVAARPVARFTSPMMGLVEEAANTCLEDGCSVDTLTDLIKELKAEATINVAGDKDKEERQKQVLIMIGQVR